MIIVLFYLFLALHLIHLIRYFRLLRSYKPVLNTGTPPFSIIIAAKNELNNLKKLLPLILEQKYPDFEIVIVLDRCVDGSVEYIRSLSSPKIKVLEIEKLTPGFSGKKNALTEGIKLANNEWLLFTDADCYPNSSYWINHFAKAIKPSTSILIGVSPYTSRHSLLNQFIQYETLYTAIRYIGAAIMRNPYMGIGRNLAYKKSLFYSKDGFYPYQKLEGGDDDLFIQRHADKVNTEVVLGQNGLTFSKPKEDLDSYLRQKTRHLHIGRYYSQKNLHIYWTAIHTLLWLCFIYLIFALPLNIGVILAFTLLLILKGLIFNLSSKKLGYTYNPIYLPISDLIFGILYPFIGVRALLLRKVKWK